MCAAWRRHFAAAAQVAAEGGEVVPRSGSHWFRKLSVDECSDYSEELPDQAGRCARLMAPRMVQPNSAPHLAWDVGGILLILWDMIVIPLLVFDIPELEHLDAMAWVTRLFWTMDIPVTFFTGIFRQDGRLDMSPACVAHHYARSWLVFDALLVIADWVEVVALAAMSYLSTARLSKVVRILRAFRVMRLARLLKLPGILGSVTERILSETAALVMGIAKSTCCVVGLAHYVACLWYRLGSMDTGQKSWLREHGVAREPVGYQYLVSAHWAVTQITGNMEVEAHNSGERIFSVLVLIVCFVLSATFISNITTSMTRLQVIGAKQQSQFSQLRRYLRLQGVSTRLAMRVTRNAQFCLKQKQQRISEGDVELVALLSEPLRVDLHFEVYSRVLCAHKLLEVYCATNPTAMRKVCHASVSTLSASKGDVLFSPGERPEQPRMYFAISGSMKYLQEKAGPLDVGPSHWLCEAALWADWTHQGALRASAECELLLLDAAKFQQISSHNFDCSDETHPAMFARAYVEHINELEVSQLTDFDMDQEHIRRFLSPVRRSDASMVSHVASREPLFAMRDRLQMLTNFGRNNRASVRLMHGVLSDEGQKRISSRGSARSSTRLSVHR